MRDYKRRSWSYLNCQIIPVRSSGFSDKKLPPIYQRTKIYRCYWRIQFPDGSWVYSLTKQSVREYIDRRIIAYPENFVPKT